MGRTYIPTLNGWRASAVLLVIGGHSAPMLLSSGTKIGALSASVFSHAGIGVDVFFAISGFLISTLLLKEKARTGSVNLADFYTRRAFRILPPMLAYLAVLSALKIADVIPSVEPSELLSSILFFRNYAGGSWYTGHFWSLAIEEHFYILVPIVLSAFSWKSSLRFAIAVIVGCAAVRYFEYISVGGTKVEFRTEARIDAIMYGAMGALLVNDYRSFFEEHLTGAVTLAIVMAALVACYLFPEMPARRTIIAAMMPIPIIFTALNPQSAIGQILELNPVQWVGKISYSLYIWQMMFLVPGVRQMPFLQSFPTAFMCVFASAIASYYLVELPMIKVGSLIRRGGQLGFSST